MFAQQTYTILTHYYKNFIEFLIPENESEQRII